MTIRGYRFLRLALICAPASVMLGVQNLTAGPAVSAAPQPPESAEIGKRLTAAYPGIITKAEGNDIVFADGTKLPLDDGKGVKPPADWLENPDIEDQFRFPYPAGAAFLAPEKDRDPGRARNEAFFTKVYGDCRTGGMDKNLVNVVWLPKKWGAKLPFSKINGAAAHLKAVSDELDQLPKKFDADLYPTAGTYNCRKVAGTKALSPHGLGIAIDIALRRSAYWRWDGAKADGTVNYRNKIPLEIVTIFEKHGFIWGGRWYHYDTMHFEYRPELLMPDAGPARPPAEPASSPGPAKIPEAANGLPEPGADPATAPQMPAGAPEK